MGIIDRRVSKLLRLVDEYPENIWVFMDRGKMLMYRESVVEAKCQLSRTKLVGVYNIACHAESVREDFELC